MPNIKWLKKIEYEATESASTAGKYPDIIDVGNEKFVVIQKSSADDVISTMQPGKRWSFLGIFHVARMSNVFTIFRRVYQ